MNNVNEIYVYENWKSDTPSLIGTLYVDGGRGAVASPCYKWNACKTSVGDW